MSVATRPHSIDELREAITAAHAAHQPAPALDLTSLDRVVAFSPDDLTVTAEAGLTVAALQRALAASGQWLPIDPPHPETTTLADLLQFDISGPRRYGYGTIREHVLGLAVVTGDGRLVRSGGRVVKNVAGYDLARLFIGDRRTLGVVVEVTCKLTPRPAAERLLALAADSLDTVAAQLDAIAAGPTTPIVLDLHTLDRAAAPWTLIVGYAGHPDDVTWQLARHDTEWQAIEALEYESRFWSGRSFAAASRTSVLPSTLVAHLAARSGIDLVSRAGNGVLYTFDPVFDAVSSDPRPPAPAVETLTRRLADAFDPHGVFRREVPS